MKKLTILVALVLAVSLGTGAQTRSLEEMTDIAARAMQQMQKQPAYGTGTPQKRPQLTVSMSSPELAVFNSSTGGWVMVSADPRTNGSVLAYNREGSFEWDNAPENLKAWVNGYKEQIRSLEGMKASAGAVSAAEDDGPGTPVVDALIRTRWNQGFPYNKFCPTRLRNNGTYLSDSLTCPTGCVATALAQILYYWKYNSSSNFRPTHSNTIERKDSCDFSQANYNWDIMIDDYQCVTDTIRNEKGLITGFTYHDFNFTDQQADEVARLMYDCGTAVDMGYGFDGSGANEANALSALLACYDYSTDIRYVARDKYQGDWDEMLRMEADAHRPVFCTGSTKSEGHAFICDGYDSNGYFHFNFGWSGTADGFYRTEALHGFNRKQVVLVGIHPAGENDHCIWQDGSCFYKADGNTALFVQYNENWNVSKLVTPDYVVIDGERCRIELPDQSFVNNRYLYEVDLKGVCTVGDDAMKGCTELTSLILDTCLQYVGYQAFANCSAISRVYCNATVPPVCDPNAFSTTSTLSTLVVPEGCVPAYEKATGWKNFVYITDHLNNDTIRLTSTDLQFGDMSQYSFDFSASDGIYTISIALFKYPLTTVEGSYTFDDMYAYYCNIKDNSGNKYPIGEADITISKAEDGINYKVTGTVTLRNGTFVILDLSYAIPEKSRSEELAISDCFIKDTRHLGYYTISGYVPDQDMTIQLYIQRKELEGTFNTDNFNSNHTFLKKGTGKGSVNYKLADADIAGTADGDSIRYTGTLLFISETDSKDVPEYTIALTCSILPSGYYTDTFDQNFTGTFSGAEVSVSTDRSNPYNAVYIEAAIEDDDEDFNYILLGFCIDSLDNGNIPAGIYNISHSHENGTVIASDGDVDNMETPSFAATVMWSFDFVLSDWFMVSGTVTVSYSDNSMLVEVDAKNMKGRSIKATITKDIVPTAVKPYRTDAQAMTYDLSGNPVTGYRKGIVIKEGNKYLR